MCRWIAYTGEPIFIEQLITLPERSLVEQSMNTEMNYDTDGSLMGTNGDGFGVGWYSERPTPGIFKEQTPAWSNENLKDICRQVKSHLFMAHVRATTQGAVQRTNCHPFKYENWLFQHNGDIQEFTKVRRDLQMQIAPELYSELKGTTDSETYFLLALTFGLQKDLKTALQKMVQCVEKSLKDHKTVDPFLNLSCAMSDGQSLYTIRYASGTPSKTQFYSRESGMVQGIKKGAENIVIVSEPLDRAGKKWTAVPDNSYVVIRDGDIKVETFI